MSLENEQLLISAQKGDIEAFDEAVANGADIKCVDEKGRGLVHYAAMNGKANYLSRLIDLGFKADVLDNDKLSPIELAAMRGSSSCIKILIERSKNLSLSSVENAIKIASKYDRPNALKELISRIDLSDSKRSLNGALFECFEQDASRCAKLLIDNGADLTAKSSKLSALEYASLSGSVGCLKVFIDNGLNLSTVKCKKMLALAAKGKKPEVIKLLLLNGVDVNSEFEGRTAISWAVYKKDKKSAAILLENGADPDINAGEKSATDYAQEAKYASFQKLFDSYKLKVLESKNKVIKKETKEAKSMKV